ncbi:MAG: D-sedoheptulose-7-phosphate isomerase [Candidatus Omnitrophota bacterium]
MENGTETQGIRASFKNTVEAHRAVFDPSFDAPHLSTLEEITRQVLKALKSGRKILFCGNGGSAADAQHIAAELIVRFKRNRPSLPAIALSTDTSILTATGNDFSFEEIFARQIEGLGQAGDVLFAISTSGESSNVLSAVERAKQKGLVTIGFTGMAGGRLKNRVDFCYQAQADETARAQEMHITAFHAIIEAVEMIFFES